MSVQELAKQNDIINIDPFRKGLLRRMSLRFEWDRKKYAANLQKHQVSFDEAITVFDDPLAVIFDDEDHSVNEYREIIIGHSIVKRLLLVSFTERTEDVIRIISARLATRIEQKDYEENSNL